jgi:hypothetical protein
MPKKKSKKPSKAEERQQRLAEYVAEAKQHRAENKGLLRELREDPGMAEDVKKLLCADLRRIAALPREIFGPGVPRRDRYRQLGRYSTSLVDFIYGQWAEFIRQAGLEDTLHTKTVKRNIAKTARAQDLARYADQHIRPWDGAYDRLNKKKKKLSFLTMSDLHSHFCNPFALRVCQDINKKLKPDGIRLNGDVVDFPSLSRHRHFPGHFPMTIQDEINWAKREVFAPLRKNNPRSDIKFLMGNHDIRLVTAMADNGPMFASLDSASFAENFELDTYKIGLVCRSNFLFLSAKQRERDIAQNWETLFSEDGRMLFTWVHGWLAGKDAPRKHARAFMTNGTNGHIHKREEISEGSYATGVIDWYQTPCMAHPAAVAAGYLFGPIEAHAWSCGALYTTIDMASGHVYNEAIKVGEEIATFRDMVWTIRDSERDTLAEMMEI